MRAWLVATLLTAVLFSGCAASNEADPVNGASAGTLGDIEDVGSGALNLTEDGAQLLFSAVALPFEHKFKVPTGATMVRFVADPLNSATISVSLTNDDTGRRRCNQQPVVGFSQTLQGERSCSTITALDDPGTVYTARASGSGNADIVIDFLARPVDGIAGELNLDLLSQADHELLPTQYMTVTSQGADGNTPAELWVEVTLPKGEGPWPTVIASSPYNGEAGRGVNPAMWTYWTQDWAQRGYAAVNVDVRGYGMSGGCVEVWGINEQYDQKFIVDWVAGQDWSDGNVGFYGQSYVGTTPVAAAVQAPEALKAIIAVAPVISAYDDWHYGGVPNGEGALSPVAYQVLTAAPGAPETQGTDITSYLVNAKSGICDPTLLPLANSPTAEYNDEFYAVRDFKLRADQVKAAVLFTEGFEDANVKSAMIPGWFNELQSEKLGVFGHWLHQHPARMDQEVLFVGWMDQYLKGKDIGFDRIPDVLINAEDEYHRTAEAWPPADDVERRLFGLDLGTGSMTEGEGAGSQMIDLDPVPANPVTVSNKEAILTMPLTEDTPIVAPELVLRGALAEENGMIHADLYEVYADGGQRILTWGRINLALRNGYDNYEPVVPGSTITATLPFRPTEHIASEGSTLRLVIRGVQAGEAVGLAQPQPGVFTISGAGSSLVLPDVPMSAYTPMPISAKA